MKPLHRPLRYRDLVLRRHGTRNHHQPLAAQIYGARHGINLSRPPRPGHPSPCLQTCPSESFYTPSGPSAQACAMFTSRVCARWNSRPRSPHLSGLHSSYIRSIPDLDCTSIEFLLYGWSRRKFRTSTTTRREFLRDRFTFRHRLY